MHDLHFCRHIRAWGAEFSLGRAAVDYCDLSVKIKQMFNRNYLHVILRLLFLDIYFFHSPSFFSCMSHALHIKIGVFGVTILRYSWNILKIQFGDLVWQFKSSMDQPWYMSVEERKSFNSTWNSMKVSRYCKSSCPY